MKKSRSTLLALVLAVSTANAAESGSVIWHPSVPGCFEQGLAQSLRNWETLRLSAGGLRIGVSPDSRGPVYAFAFERSAKVSEGGASGATILAAVSSSLLRTCVVRFPVSACPGAAEAMDRLIGFDVPVGISMEPEFILRLHPTQYSLEVTDSFGLSNRWVAYDGHPLATLVAESVEVIRPCMESSLEGSGADPRPGI